MNRQFISMAAYGERYGLSVVYFCLAWNEFLKCRDYWAGQAGASSAVMVEAGRHLTVLLLTLFTGWLLLFGRRAMVPPERLKYILIPLATTFFNLAYFTVPWFPESLQLNLCSATIRAWMFLGGLTCIIIGPVIALWGLWQLGRSFGVFVTVRKVVLTGPYRWTRHPMYLGWICACFGVAVANCSPAYFFLVTVHISLLVYRARLEEALLAEHSPEYRNYMTRSGFIFPRFRRTRKGLVVAD